MLQMGMKVKGQIMQDFRNSAPSFPQNRDVGGVVTEGGRRLSRGMTTGAKDLKPETLRETGKGRKYFCKTGITLQEQNMTQKEDLGDCTDDNSARTLTPPKTQDPLI